MILAFESRNSFGILLSTFLAISGDIFSVTEILIEATFAKFGGSVIWSWGMSSVSNENKLIDF